MNIQMPLYIRHLPGKPETILEHKGTAHHVFFNPSFAKPMLYVRAIEHSPTKENNFVVLINTETKDHTVVQSPYDKMAPTVNLFQGIEDLRICWFQERLWFSGTTTHMTSRMTNELIVGHFNKELTQVEKISAVDIGSLPVKNVCPFVWNNQLHLLDTFLESVYELSEECTDDGIFHRFVATKVRTLQGCHEKYRGSTSPVHLHGNTWGCVVHDIIFNDSTRLVTRLSYIHHWMEFDITTGAITFLSSPFWAAHWGIEYVSGLDYHRESGKVTLFLGVNDASPVAYHTTLADIRVGKY